MHQSWEFKLLADCGNGYISECSCCNELNFAYKNIPLAFPKEEMFRFLDWVIEFRFQPESYQPLPHHRDRVYCSPLSNMFLAFNETELEEIEMLLEQTRILLETRRLIAIRRKFE
jgi:hypothetical protein